MRTLATATKVSVVLPASPEALAIARAAVRDLADELCGRAPDVELLVTELVANGLRHADSETNTVALMMIRAADRLRVEVSDGGEGFEPPTAPRPGELATSGWGLALLDNLAAGWGVSAEPHTTVWFEMDLPPGVAVARLAA